ncbi:hypothetical protein CVM73_24550 [Bradyrhizobium forestalis]|uniref:Uncharacterized protein n=1 Tax=Bradyrhizobium forestalis TaxID=1419263 RepID=A0A2M8R439_9BRAD|nr:hypothetical protein [Bradyrhizobium forestalis]PJG52587.1 hypothetical protein CVM73_24550 [Bradyrhizobium forestalis]
MTKAEDKEIGRRVALFARAADLFDRLAVFLPLAIAFLNGWPTEVKSYQELVVSGAWKGFLSCALYQLAAFALKRAVEFAKSDLAP